MLNNTLVTKSQLAELFGVTEAVIDAWEAMGMPAAPPEDPRPTWTGGWEVSRADVARFLGVHVDSVTKAVAYEGLDAALITRGGHGKAQIFDFRKVFQWDLARKHPRLVEENRRDDELAKAAIAGVLRRLTSPSPRAARRRTNSKPKGGI
jgi:phage terminase Nu1 subunit (DNA packaging protein)